MRPPRARRWSGRRGSTDGSCRPAASTARARPGPPRLRAGPQRADRQLQKVDHAGRREQRHGPRARLEADARARRVRLRKLARAGPAGPYHTDRCLYRFRFILDYSGGQTTNFGAHAFDIAQWALGTDATGADRIRRPGVRVSAQGEPVHHGHQGPFPRPLCQRRGAGLREPAPGSSASASRAPRAGSSWATSSRARPSRWPPPRSVPARSTCR